MEKKLITSLLILSSLLIFTWCNTKQVATWDVVTVSYDSFLQDWKEIEKWIEKTFTVWIGEIFPVFDKEIIWMKLWETKSFVSNIEDWYGIYSDINKIQDITNTVFNTIWQEPTVWEIIELWDMKGLVLEVWPVTVKVDFNKPETREPVEFKVKVLKIEERE